MYPELNSFFFVTAHEHPVKWDDIEKYYVYLEFYQSLLNEYAPFEYRIAKKNDVLECISRCFVAS